MKSSVFRREGHKKTTSRGDCLKKRAWTVCRLRRWLGKKEEMVSLRVGGDTPIMIISFYRKED